MLNKLFQSKLFFFSKEIEIKRLVLIGFLYRFILFSVFYTTITKMPDSWSFMELSEYLLRFDLTNYNGQRTPGFPLLIALGFGKMWVTVIYQFIIGVVTSVYWYKTFIALKFNKKASFYFTLFLESFLTVFFYETNVLVEPLALFFTTVLFYEIANGYFQNYSIKKELWIGFILGYLVLIKPFFAYIGFLMYGFYILENFSFRKIINQKIIILLFPLFAYFGWSYINKINTGHFVSTTFFGLNLAQNCVYFAEKGSKEYDWIMKSYVKQREISIRDSLDVSMTIWRSYEYDLKKTHPNFPDLSEKLGKYAIQTIKSNPKDYAYQVIFRSWIDYWKPFMAWHYDQFNFKYVNKLFLAVWYLQCTLTYIFTLIFFIITPKYLLEYTKNRKVTFEIFGIILIYISSILQALVTYGTNGKYSYPFDFLLIMIVLIYLKEKNRLPKRLNTFLQ